MEKIIDSLLASADSIAFREPVDWRGLGLHDYPVVIKRPMDLGTVKHRLQQGAYSGVDKVAADVRLIWENCRTYNCGGVPRKLHKAADVLSKRFEARFAKLNEAGGGVSTKVRAKGKRNAGAKGAADAASPTDEDRCKLARHLSRARMEDVTAAVHEIDRHCPDALVLKGDTIEVDVDRLNAWTFCSVERVVAPQAAMWRAARSTSRRARKKRPASRYTRNDNSGASHVVKARGGDGDSEGQVEALTKGAGRPSKKAKVEACSGV